MKIKQKTLTGAYGIIYKCCPICNEIITDGVYFRNGVEIHNKCLAIARARRGKIAGIDYTI